MGSNVRSLEHPRTQLFLPILMMQPNAGKSCMDCSLSRYSHSVVAMSHLRAGGHTGCGNSASRLCPHRVAIEPVKSSGMPILKDKAAWVPISNGYHEGVRVCVCAAAVDLEVLCSVLSALDPAPG